jgi:hypothetical protein
MRDELSGMIFDGQEGSLLAADAHHHRSSVALMGGIYPGDRQSPAITRYEKMPAPISQASISDE